MKVRYHFDETTIFYFSQKEWERVLEIDRNIEAEQNEDGKDPGRNIKKAVDKFVNEHNTKYVPMRGDIEADWGDEKVLYLSLVGRSGNLILGTVARYGFGTPGWAKGKIAEKKKILKEEALDWERYKKHRRELEDSPESA